MRAALRDDELSSRRRWLDELRADALAAEQRHQLRARGAALEDAAAGLGGAGHNATLGGGGAGGGGGSGGGRSATL